MRLSAAARASTSCCRSSWRCEASRWRVGAWLAREPVAAASCEALRALRGPFAMFRRGEPLALMPFTFLR